MEIKVYLHRTKKHDFAVADAFAVEVDLDKLPEDKKEDIDFINQGFANDCQKMARRMDCVKKYGTGYISFMRPQFEGDKKDNGNEKIYFDNKKMIFVKRRAKRTKKTEEAKGE